MNKFINNQEFIVEIFDCEREAKQAGEIGDAILAARSKWLDNTISPIGYILTATPYMWLGILLAWLFGIVLGWFPIAGAYSFNVAGLLQRWQPQHQPNGLGGYLQVV
jgi:hypothetical protein